MGRVRVGFKLLQHRETALIWDNENETGKEEHGTDMDTKASVAESSWTIPDIHSDDKRYDRSLSPFPLDGEVEV